MDAHHMNKILSRRSVLLAGSAAVVGSLPAAAEVAVVKKLTAAQLATMLTKKDFFLVNVHIPYEGEVANTDAFIDYDTITDHLDKLPKDKNASIVLYCRGGGMSDIASRALVHLGYSQVSDLVGGMNGWKDAGFPLIEK